MKSFGDEALGMISSFQLHVGPQFTEQQGVRCRHGEANRLIPGLYAAGMYINGMVAEAAVKALDGKTDDKEALIKAMRAVSLEDSPRGPFHFDHFGNVVGNVYHPPRW